MSAETLKAPPPAGIELRAVRKYYGAEHVLGNFNLAIEAGSFSVLLGPSGCGKSTILRLMAGLEKCDEGDILIDGQSMKETEPGDRGIAMVFQNYALYPTMSVAGNIEFGLRNAGIPKSERALRVAEIAETVGLGQYLKKKPQHLSGGQRQRVALARAMVKKPRIFLMDEPLSNLDAKLRSQLRSDLIELHRQLGTTFVYVTHDQTEAMSMGSRIILLQKGRIMQDATPEQLYMSPANIFSAGFIGTPPMNLLKAKEIDSKFPTGTEHVGFRPETANIALDRESIPKGSLIIEGELAAKEMLGSESLYLVRHGDSGIKVRLYENRQIPYGLVSVHVHHKDLAFFNHEGERVQ